MLGNPPPYHKAALQLQAEIQAENAISGDLIQGDFTDNYRNLSIKHLLALHYVKDHCKNFRYKNWKNQTDCSNSFEEKKVQEVAHQRITLHVTQITVILTLSNQVEIWYVAFYA